MPVDLKVRLDTKRLARLLAVAMTVADLSGRAKVLDEAREATGRSFRPKIGPSFAAGGLDRLLARAAQFADSRLLAGAERGKDAHSLTVAAQFAEAEVLAPESLEPTEALGFFRQRIGMTRRAFDRLGRRYREVAFTVANVESVALIEQIQEIAGEVLAEGQTQAEFRRRVDLAMKAAGVSALNPFHLETVFNNAVNSAYQLGRVSQMLQADVRRALPVWQYRTVGDDRVRPAHRALHGFTARHDDAVWRSIAPPNGHNCRCSLVALTREQARRRGVDLRVPGRKRLPAQPDEGWDTSPVIAFEKRLTESRGLGFAA